MPSKKITPGSVVIFGEFNVVDFFVEFTVVVNDMHGFFSEKLGKFGVLVQHISQIANDEVRRKSPQKQLTFP